MDRESVLEVGSAAVLRLGRCRYRGQGFGRCRSSVR